MSETAEQKKKVSDRANREEPRAKQSVQTISELKIKKIFFPRNPTSLKMFRS